MIIIPHLSTFLDRWDSWEGVYPERIISACGVWAPEFPSSAPLYSPPLSSSSRVWLLIFFFVVDLCFVFLLISDSHCAGVFSSVVQNPPPTFLAPASCPCALLSIPPCFFTFLPFSIRFVCVCVCVCVCSRSHHSSWLFFLPSFSFVPTRSCVCVED